MIEYHPYDLDIDGDTDLNRKNIAEIESTLAGRETIRFAVISDTQRWYDETEDVVEALNRRSDVDFVVHAGDISDFGMKMEFEKQRDILQGLNAPFFCLLGNHDCLATGKDVFNRIFGEENFSFTAGNVHFLCLNTNALEFDYSEAVPDFTFMEDNLASLPPQAEKTIALMHAPPYSEQFNNNSAKAFQHYLQMYPSLQCCVYGHVHVFSEQDIFNDGIIYYATPCIHKRAYLYFTINKDSYEYELVEF